MQFDMYFCGWVIFGFKVFISEGVGQCYLFVIDSSDGDCFVMGYEGIVGDFILDSVVFGEIGLEFIILYCE